MPKSPQTEDRGTVCVSLRANCSVLVLLHCPCIVFSISVPFPPRPPLNFIFPPASCGGSNKNDAHRLIESATISRGGLVGVGLALLEGVCYWGRALRSQVFKPAPVSLFIPVNPDVEPSATAPAPCLPAFYDAFRHDDNGLKL